jgi:hypothetical protein
MWIRLEARDSAANIARYYEIEIVDRDLLGDVVVVMRNGRIGGRNGHTCRIATHDLGEADRVVANALRRRDTSRRRIGTDYLIVDWKGTWPRKRFG